jgi:LPS-assembly protein
MLVNQYIVTRLRLRCITATAIILAWPITAVATESDTTPHSLDWIKAQAMTDEQRSKLPSNCCGGYVEPQYNGQDADLKMEDAPLRIKAISTEAPSDSVAILEGDVEIFHGNREVRSSHARVDKAIGQVSLKGNVQFREPGLLLIGDEAIIDMATRNVQVNNVTYVIHKASVRGVARQVNRTTEDIIVISDASYSSCEPGDSSWQLVTKEIKIDQDSGFATVRNARLEIKDVPIFYLPYMKFPIDDRRASGLLFPWIDMNQKNGLDFTQPIYWNIAENYDATISPRYIQHRGFSLETDFRYLNSWSKSKVSAAFLNNDKGGNDAEKIDPLTGLYLNEGEDRYKFNLSHVGGEGLPWSTLIDYSRVSDIQYVRDLGNMTLDETSRTHLQQRVDASYKTDHWNYRIESRDYQVITEGLDDQYSVLPNLVVDGYYRFANNMVIDLNTRYTMFNHSNPDMVEGSRSRVDYGISWDQRWNWGYFKPKIQLKHLAYSLDYPDDLSAQLTNRSPEITVPVYSLDTSVLFDRNSSWLAGYTQTFEPRLFYLKSTYRDQSSLPDFDTRELTPSYEKLFRDGRFVGGDRISDDKRLTVGFTTRFIDQASGQERFRASIAQSVYYADRLVTLTALPTATELSNIGRDKSLIAIELAGRINKKWRFNTDLVYNDFDRQLQKSSLSLRYNDQERRLFNFTYRYTSRAARLYDVQSVDQDIKQATVSAFIPVSNNFNLVGRWSHDFTNRRELEVFAGFEYNNCCWRASLVARRWLDRNDKVLFPEQELRGKNGLFFQIEFKGLAGSSGRVDTMLSNGIYGYEHTENL